MPFPNKDTQFKPGISGNPLGKPIGTKHITTWIQDLLNDEEFTVENVNFGGKPYKGAPLRAIIMVAINQALQGDNKWADWLAKYGYGQKLDLTTNGKDMVANPVSATLLDKFVEDLKDASDDQARHN